MFARGTSIPISGHLRCFSMLRFGCKLLQGWSLSIRTPGTQRAISRVAHIMDIQRPSNARAKRIKRVLYVTGAVIAIAGITLGLSRLKPAAPTVDASTV